MHTIRSVCSFPLPFLPLPFLPLPFRLPLAFAVALAAAPCLADEKATCIEASEQGQVLRDEGKLLAAHDKFLVCSRQACPAIVRNDCTGWLADVKARTPTVVLSAVDPQGHDIVEARVLVDGAPLAQGLDGRAIPLDPGTHVFRFERARSAPIEQRVIVREGELHRTIVAHFDVPASTEPWPSSSASSSSPRVSSPPGAATPVVVPILFGGLAVACGTAFAVLASGAKSDATRLRETCAPNCEEADVASIRTKLIVANIALGTGALAAGAAILSFVLRPSTSSPRPTTSFAVSPGLGGITAWIDHSF